MPRNTHKSLADSLHVLSGVKVGVYRLLDSIGSGGYGVVYRAADTQAGHIYAVKCLSKAQPNTRRALFQQRELTLHQLVCDHPNVLTLHQVFSDKDFVYVVLDLCDEGDLFAAIVDRRLYLHNSKLIKIAFVQLVDALSYCHERSVWHRDIKPENVMCTADGTKLLLGDFGLATTKPVSDEFGCGSKYYMSPECINEELQLPNYSLLESDIWSLGVILYNLLSIQNPWKYATTQDDHFSSFLHDPLFFRRVLSLSEGANIIFRRIFTMNPSERISCAALKDAILGLDNFYMAEGETLSQVVETSEPQNKIPKIVIQGTTNSPYVSSGSASTNGNSSSPYGGSRHQTHSFYLCSPAGGPPPLIFEEDSDDTESSSRDIFSSSGHTEDRADAGAGRISRSSLRSIFRQSLKGSQDGASPFSEETGETGEYEKGRSKDSTILGKAARRLHEFRRAAASGFRK